MTAILFGSIGTIADTSEIQRESFNEAFRSHGLDWSWDRAEYQQMLAISGGRSRIASYAESRGEIFDAASVHSTKSTVFQNRLRHGVDARPGVLELIERAKGEGVRLALVTSTSPSNVSTLIDGIGAGVRDSFEFILDATMVADVKPDPAVFQLALEKLAVEPSLALAIEDNVDGIKAAKSAGLWTAAFPNAYTSGHDFSAADHIVGELDGDTACALIARLH